MRGAQDLIWGLVRMALIAAGLFYAGQVLIAYATQESHERPKFDAGDRLRSAERLLIWGGVMTVWVIAQLARPLIDMLSEASAEVGEWAISRREHATTRSRVK
jgi:hypothetical protein